MATLLSRKYFTSEFVTEKRIAGYTLKAICQMFDPPLSLNAVYSKDRSAEKLGFRRHNNLEVKNKPREQIKRKCLSCAQDFYSEEPKSVNRICPRCKDSNKNAVVGHYEFLGASRK